MEYVRFEQSWEEELKLDNLTAAYELVKKQTSVNIIRTLNYFLDKPLNEVDGIYQIMGLSFDFAFETEMGDIINPFIEYQEKFLGLGYTEDILKEEEYCSPEKINKDLRYLIELCAKLEIKVASSITQLDERAITQRIEDAVPEIVDSLVTLSDLYDKYIANDQIEQFVNAYKKPYDPIKALWKLLSAANFLLDPEKGRKYLSTEKLSKMHLYQKYAIWAIQVLIASEEKMKQLFPGFLFDRSEYPFWQYLNGENISGTEEVKTHLRNYSLPDLLAEARETILKICRI